MIKSKKIAVITAIFFIALGTLLALVGFWQLNGDFKKLNTKKQTETTYTVNNPFENIDIDCSVEDINFIISNDGESKVVCNKTEKISYSVNVDENTLKIKRIDNRKWYKNISIGIYWESEKISVYLSEKQFNFLKITSDTSDISISKEFSFEKADITTDTGDVEFLALVKSSLNITTSTGDIKIENNHPENLTVNTDTGDISINSTDVNEKIKLDTDTGEINLKKVNSNSITVESNTGDIFFTNVIALKDIDIESDTGDVKLISSDSQNIYIKTDTGNVYGNILTEKIFMTESDTGNINVPKSVNGGICDVETNTGDIRFLIKQ